MTIEETSVDELKDREYAGVAFMSTFIYTHNRVRTEKKWWQFWKRSFVDRMYANDRCWHNIMELTPTNAAVIVVCTNQEEYLRVLKHLDDLPDRFPTPDTALVPPSDFETWLKRHRFYAIHNDKGLDALDRYIAVYGAVEDINEPGR